MVIIRHDTGPDNNLKKSSKRMTYTKIVDFATQISNASVLTKKEAIFKVYFY